MCCGSIKLTKKLKEFLKCEVPVDQSKPGLTHLIEHVININNHSPIKQRRYSVSPKVYETIVAELDAMLADDIVETSQSGWSTPVVMIKKPDGTYRFCLDFRKLHIHKRLLKTRTTGD